MPTSSEFDDASEDGDRAHVHFVLPGVVRAGVEVRPADDLRIEVAYVHEFWSAHQDISAVPEGITIDGVTGLPPKLAIPPIDIPRGFQDSDSFRLGGEYHFVLGYLDRLRAGVAYETIGGARRVPVAVVARLPEVDRVRRREPLRRPALALRRRARARLRQRDVRRPGHREDPAHQPAPRARPRAST